MAVAYKSVGGTATGTTQVLPAHPIDASAPAAGDLLIIGLSNKLESTGPNAITNWINLGSISGGAGSAGGGTGQVKTTAFVKEAVGGETGTVTVDIPSGNVSIGKIYVFSKSSGYSWRYRIVSGVRNAVGGSPTAWSVTSTENIETQPGDVIVTISSINSNAYTFTSEAVTQTGATIDNTSAEKTDTGTNTGNDIKQVGSVHTVTSGHGTGALTFTMTSSGSAAEAPTGGTLFIILRQHKRRIIRGSIKPFGLAIPQTIPDGIDLWDGATVTEPTYASMTDGQYFWYNESNVGLRNSFHWSGTNYSTEVYHGRRRFKLSVNPRVPDFSGAGHYNYRAEVSGDWESGMPLGTKDAYALDIIVPDEGFKPHSGDMDFMQYHTGSYPGETSNDPVIYCCFSKAGVEDDDNDVSAENEIVIVRKVVDWEQRANPNISGRFNTGVVANGGDRLSFLFLLTSGINGAGHLKVIFQKKPLGGSWSGRTVLFDATESTSWPIESIPIAGSNPNVHPDWKGGIYYPTLRNLSGVLANEALNGGAVGSFSVYWYVVAFQHLTMTPSHSHYYSDVSPYIDTSIIP